MSGPRRRRDNFRDGLFLRASFPRVNGAKPHRANRGSSLRVKVVSSPRAREVSYLPAGRARRPPVRVRLHQEALHMGWARGPVLEGEWALLKAPARLHPKVPLTAWVRARVLGEEWVRLSGAKSQGGDPAANASLR